MTSQLIPIRLSHLLGQSGVGAIVRAPDALVVVHDTREWTARDGTPGGRPIPYVDRVRAALGVVQQLREPPVAREGKGGQVDGVCVPVTRFPSWARCPNLKCGALFHKPWYAQDTDSPVCTRCQPSEGRRPVLQQITWVLVSPAGHLSDVPWHYLAHPKGGCEHRDKLSLIEKGSQLRLRCDACQSTAEFRGDEQLPFGKTRMQPWAKNDLVDHSEAAENGALARVLAVNDARVYVAEAAIAMVIPPESRVRKGTTVDRLYRSSVDRLRIDAARTPRARKGAMREVATRYRCSIRDVEEALRELDLGYPQYGQNFTPGQLRESEYNALLEFFPDQQPDEDLVTHDRTEGWHALAHADGASSAVRQRVMGVSHLVRVDRLKAIKVFKGFRRLGEGEEVVPPDIIGQSDWLPAVELWGEGIFMTLDEDRLKRWEQAQALTQRLAAMRARFNQSGRKEPAVFTPRFVLLHTLAHLLMRQIESEGGYPAASLSELLYCANHPNPMAGLLIYVAVPDIAGSLGGLAELAEPRRFLGILTRALEHARWCSLDPVCSEHEGQGPGLLNRSACHACALVPDTACEYGNTLLDRGVVKGDPDAGLPAFFEMG